MDGGFCVCESDLISICIYIYLETVCENDTSRSACCLFVGQEFARCELRFKRKMMMTSSHKQSVTDRVLKRRVIHQ